MKKPLQYVFVLCILLALTLGLVQTIFFPKDINEYENRYAEKIAMPTLSGFLDGTFQQSVEDGLTDQVTFSELFKKVYNRFTSLLLKVAITPVLNANPDRYIAVENSLLFGDYIAYRPRVLSNMTALLDAKLENYNALLAQHPDLDIYVYYIEKDTDVNFETGEQVGASEYIQAGLNLPEGRFGSFTVDSFEDFSAYFYHTDHHWKAEGSLEGYRQVLAMLKPGDTPLEPLEAVEIGTLSGSKATGRLDAFSELFSAYRYELPEMTVTANGDPAEDYGDQEAFFSGQRSDLTYGRFYGADLGEIIFETGNEGCGNLLVIGESYDNAILKLLASHYDKTCSIDLRYYDTWQGIGEPFAFSEYVQKHEIDTVLLIGNIDFYTMAEFNLEG